MLSHSRKGYSEVVWRQTTEVFLRCVENAFRHFGGVTKVVVPDNLKAAVLHADWHDPEINPKLLSFAEHYGTAILPTKPARPRHKGKVEAGVKYAQNNAVKGRRCTSLAEQNLFLTEWECTVADTRIHGTVRQQVGQLFTTVEHPALQPLPASLFPSFEEVCAPHRQPGRPYRVSKDLLFRAAGVCGPRGLGSRGVRPHPDLQPADAAPHHARPGRAWPLRHR